MSKNFEELGINKDIIKSCKLLKWSSPTPIQVLAIPPALLGRNLVALAETGSGKTGAYALPIIQKLMENPIHYFAIVLAPTRELAMQVQQQFMGLGKILGLNVVLLVGGIPTSEQAKQLKLKPPHIVIATPGRFIDHVKKTKGFDEIKLKSLKFLVIDEADRMMGTDFIKILERILSILPRERQTLLFSATLSDKVNKLTKAAIRDPVKISTRKNKFQSVSKLLQYVYLVPHSQIDSYLICLLRYSLGLLTFNDKNQHAKGTIDEIFPSLIPLKLNHEEPENSSDSYSEMLYNSAIIFTRKRETSNRLALLLRQFINSPIIALNGDMPQAQRIGALSKFKKSPGSILVATDIASRGLDIPLVGLVINYDIPLDAKTYMHRIGRTARAGRDGCALTLLTQYSVVFYMDEIEKHLMDSDGKSALKVPSLLKPDSEEDKYLEKLADEIQEEVKDASARSKKTVDDLSKGKRKFAGAFTSVQDVKTSTVAEISNLDLEKPGLRKTQFGCEASQEQRLETAKVFAAISTVPTLSDDSYQRNLPAKKTSNKRKLKVCSKKIHKRQKR